RSKTWRLMLIALIVAGVAAWAAADVWTARPASLRAFDAADVAQLETQMWRSYYDQRHLALFMELATLMRRQYHMPLLQSYVSAFHAAKPAFIFKDGTNRADYVRALPDLIDYYSAIRRISNTGFDPKRAAQLDLEWWIVHR